MNIASVSKSLYVHNEKEKLPNRVFTPHIGDINCCQFNHNGHVVATGGVDGVIKLTHVAREAELQSLSDQNKVN